jgi:sacsin
MKNQMIAFTAAISEFDRPFQGTIIRIPLRTLAQAEKSEICERETTISEVKNVLERFGAEFHHTGLLFMKNVEKISISVGDANPTYIEISNNESVRRNKTTINQMIKRAFAEAVDTFNLSFEIEIEYGQIGAKKQTSFAVHHQIGDNPKDKELREWSKAQAVIPWVAIAAQLPLHTAEPTQGSLFTVLPLPIHINQPVHIHGLFSTSPDRARLHRKGDSSVQDQLPARWNQWLFDTPIPMAWTQMLLHLAQHYPDQSSFGMWPRMLDNPSDECYGIDQKVLRIIDDEKPAAWYTSLGYITLDSGLLASGGESPRLKTVLHDAGVPVIYLTDQLRSSVVKACKPKIMSPEKLCKRLQHKGGELQTLSDENKQTLLDYLVSDPEFCGYGAVELFPFEDGSHRSIDHHIAFVHRDDAEHYLFSREQNFNIDLAKVSSNTLQILQNGCRASSLHSSLRHRSSHDLKAYCLGTLFKQIAPGQDVVSVEGDAAVFIPKVWDWILARGHSILDESISSLWLLPLTNGHYRRVKPLDPSSETIYAPPGETGDFLRKLAAVTATCNRAILLADSLSSKSLQLLIKEAKNDSTLRIRNGTVLEDFVLWLSKIHGVIEIVPSRDKRRVLELIAPRLHLGADPLVVSNALRGLAVFEKAAWKVENNTMYVN